MEADLKKRFGTLVAAHRKRRNWTQQELAEATSSSLSVNMIGRIETGKTGVSFETISNLAQALEVDPSEFFTLAIKDGPLLRPKLSEIAVRLSPLSDADLDWISRLVGVALDKR